MEKFNPGTIKAIEFIDDVGMELLPCCYEWMAGHSDIRNAFLNHDE